MKRMNANPKVKFWAAVVMVALLLMLSAVGANNLLKTEKATGSMDIKWKVKVNIDSGGVLNTSGDGAIVNDADANEIKKINMQGDVEWSYPYSSPSEIIAENGHVCLIDVDNNWSASLICLEMNGSLDFKTIGNWSYAFVGSDGRIYASMMDAQIGCRNTAICFNGNGSIAWEYSENGDDLGIWLTYSDDTTVLISTHDGQAKDLISVASNGTILGKFNITSEGNDVYDHITRNDNGTISVFYFNMNTYGIDVTGISEDMTLLWSEQNYTYSSSDNVSVTSAGSIVYYENLTSETDNKGIESNYVTLCAYNTSDDKVLYRVLFSGSLIGQMWVVGDTVYLYRSMLYVISPEGRVYLTNDTSGWSVAGTYDGGLLLYDSIGLKLIGNEGSTIWQYDLDGAVIDNVNTEPDGSILVVTSDYVAVVYKSEMTATMVYLVGIVAFDIALAATALLWLLDKGKPKADEA